jgi:hypothetical protein
MVENREPTIFFRPSQPIQYFLYDNSQKGKYKTKCSPLLQKKWWKTENPQKFFFAPPKAIPTHPIFSFMTILKNNICKRYKIEDCNYDT